MSSSCSSTDLGIDADFEEILTDSLINDIEVFAEHINRLRQALDPNSYVPDGETKCVQVHAALSMVSQSVRDLLVRHPIFKTSLVLIPASQLVHSVKAISFDNANVDSVKTLQCIEKLEAAVGNTLRQCMHGHSNSQSPTSKRTTATLGRKLDKQTSVYVSAAASASTSNSEGQQNGLRSRLARRHSTFQPKTTTNAADSEARLMHELLSCHEDGMELAFSRCKAWSKYVGHLLTFVRNRLSLEHEHAKSVQKLAEQTKTLLTADANNNCLPLVGIFNELMDYSSHFSTRAEQVISALNLRFVQTLEGRQKDHDNKRRKLKAEWTKQRKQYDACVEELRRARQNLNSKEDGYLKARDSTLRHEQSVPAGILTTEITRKRKEVEKRRKNEEDALNRKTDAEHEVWRLELELDGRSRGLDELRLHIVNDLCDLIRHQHITTTACASHYFKAFADLWAPVPEEYDRLAHAIRENSPGTEYMSFLQNLPGRSVSSASLFRGYNKAEDDSMPYSAATGMSDSVSSPGTSSLTARRRNALNADEHYEIIAETTHRRQKKSMSRLFEPSSSSVIDQSDAARSHHLQRTRQVTMRCDHCEHLVIFDAVKCTACGIVWHKKCLAHVSVFCGPSARRLTDSASRRMSIFGVPLKGHLEAQKRRVPLILEKCIDELQHRGMTCKGIYRTCGVKSKIEQICACFEQATTEIDVKLNDVHPMNLASVVKLYLRKLPEPLMSFSLYREWLDFDTDMEHTALVKCLRELALKLPEQNYDTLKCLLLHLKKVTWFEAENLMTASNLAAVISPSLIWHRAAHTGPSTPANAAAISHTSFISDAHLQTKVVETLIRNAFEIFSVDEQLEWKAFFECYPDVPEPTVCSTDLAVTNIGVDDTGALCDEDDLEEEYELCDEEPEPTCSSSLVSQQPPTPDLLRNTSNARKLESSSDDMDLDGATSAATFNALVRKYKGNATENNAAAAALPPSPQTAANERNKISKQRSYTTSILVSPQSDRKMILPQKQHSVEESEQDIREGNTRRNTLRSGEVTVDIKKGQYFLPTESSNRVRMGNKDRPPLSSSSMRHSPSDTSENGCTRSAFSSTAQDGVQPSETDIHSNSRLMEDRYGERICLQSVGVIFTGNDVSYV